MTLDEMYELEYRTLNNDFKVLAIIAILSLMYIAIKRLNLKELARSSRQFAVVILLLLTPCMIGYLIISLALLVLDGIYCIIEYLYLRLFCEKARRRNGRYWKKVGKKIILKIVDFCTEEIETEKVEAKKIKTEAKNERE